MARLISAYEPAVLLSVEKQGDMVENRMWDWRLGYIGKPGCLSIWQSEQKSPDEQFISMNCYSTDVLKTNFGEIVREGNLLSITTKNSRYTFLTGPEVEICQKNESDNLERVPSD
jgi:hypothetical protein